jgi:hypothetical protein
VKFGWKEEANVEEEPLEDGEPQASVRGRRSMGWGSRAPLRYDA